MGKVVFTSANYKSYFAWENFRGLEPEQRQDLINFTVEQIRQEKGLKNVDVNIQDMKPSSRGSCSQNYGLFNQFKGHTLTLNSDVLTSHRPSAPYSIYNTINHELEHASQYEHAAEKAISNDNAAVLEQRLNDQHYYSASGDKISHNADGSVIRTVDGRIVREARFDSETDYQLYRAQACEADARQAGLKAVEALQKNNQANGINDVFIEEYIESTQANEVAENRIMMQQLGMHSRESLAREELSHISEEKVSKSAREKVIEYAREKDFEVAQEVLMDDAYGEITEAEIRDKFENNEGYSDFFATDGYNEKKVAENERKEYKFARYKWNENNIETSEERSEQRDAFRHTMTDLTRSDDSVERKREAFTNSMSQDGGESSGDVKRGKFINSMNAEAVAYDGGGTQAKGAEAKVGR